MNTSYQERIKITWRIFNFVQNNFGKNYLLACQKFNGHSTPMALTVHSFIIYIGGIVRGTYLLSPRQMRLQTTSFIDRYSNYQLLPAQIEILDKIIPFCYGERTEADLIRPYNPMHYAVFEYYYTFQIEEREPFSLYPSLSNFKRNDSVARERVLGFFFDIFSGVANYVPVVL
ncbi:hypothetical protein PV783_13700 [Chitinophaga sp. CC14]|uniref:hypothetical protein n=1 Tax=Chitinophaga sp. CC14 TaxID=3029199 RepID=UPI003B7CEC96